jgi:hypothetical protein
MEYWLNMKKYENFVDLLPLRERYLLEDLGVDLQTTAAIFRKKLSEEELRVVWRIFGALKYRIGEEDDRINWALGDWMVQVGEWYGTEFLDKWMPWMISDLGLEPHRDDFYRLVGGTLIRLQCLEDVIAACCLILETVGVSLSPGDFLSLDSKIRKQTLGRLVNLIKAKVELDSDLDVRLSQFVDQRNRFVHRLWFEEITKSDFGHILLQNLENFSIHLVKECDYMLRVFEGFRVILLQETKNSGEIANHTQKVPLSFIPGSWQVEAMKMAASLINIKEVD